MISILALTRQASQQLEEQCAWKDSVNMPVEATRSQFLTTEVIFHFFLKSIIELIICVIFKVDDMGNEGVVIYQIAIQRLEFEVIFSFILF